MPVEKPFRIVMHWTAGGNDANASDIKAYHEIVEGDGSRVLGTHAPEANNDTSDGHYARHTGRFNTGAIGLSMAAMHGAKDRPFSKGSSPITKTQLAAFVEMVAEYCYIYSIPIDREHVLSHAEVPITHGVPQPGKWDIRWIPGMQSVGDPLEVGDEIRAMVRDAHSRLYDSGTAVVTGAGHGDDDDQLEDLAREIAALLRKHLRQSI